MAFEGGNEYQIHGTPHFHGQVHIVCVYQYATLKEIAEKIEAGLLQTRDMRKFQEWYHVERPLEETSHQEYGPRAEQELRAPTRP